MKESDSKTLMVFLFSAAVAIFVIFIITLLLLPKNEKIISPIPEDEPVMTASPTPQPTAKPTRTWKGKVSHYSVAGCLGCSPTLTMANGEKLDDNKMTIAFNWLPMNSRVRITNLDNGKSVVATVTDTGGFNRLGRIADLVPAVANELETKTDTSLVKIEAL